MSKLIDTVQSFSHFSWKIRVLNKIPDQLFSSVVVSAPQFDYGPVELPAFLEAILVLEAELMGPLKHPVALLKLVLE